jgi:hypothetical protein
VWLAIVQHVPRSMNTYGVVDAARRVLGHDLGRSTWRDLLLHQRWEQRSRTQSAQLVRILTMRGRARSRRRSVLENGAELLLDRDEVRARG